MFNTFSMKKLLIFEENIILIIHMFIICYIYFKKYQFTYKGYCVKGACLKKNCCLKDVTVRCSYGYMVMVPKNGSCSQGTLGVKKYFKVDIKEKRV